MSKTYVTTSVRSVLLTSRYPNHTFNRTFNGAAKLLDTAISTPALSLCQIVEEPVQEIPHALQGEIFQLENTNKFRIYLDPKRGHNRIQLVCHWEDKHLPHIPPINVTIPATYPFESPMCTVLNEDYLGTEFLKNIYMNLVAHIGRLPRLYSLTRLLDAWETAVRQTFSPKRVAVVDISEIFGV